MGHFLKWVRKVVAISVRGQDFFQFGHYFSDRTVIFYIFKLFKSSESKRGQLGATDGENNSIPAELQKVQNRHGSNGGGKRGRRAQS